MARVWTGPQSDAIKTRDKTLLVSAAAGSGKTATLTERIIRSILDKDNPIDLSEMLIVTFTKAATAELRERIGAAITDALRADPGNTRLEEQLYMLPSAKISTIDSFCSDILRSNCERVGVNPGYRIADEAEATLLAENILGALIDEIYAGMLGEVATAEELSALSECLTDTKGEGDLGEIMLSIHYATKDLEEGVSRVRALVEEYNTEHITAIEQTRLGAHTMHVAHEMAEHYIALFEKHIDANIAYGSQRAKCQKRAEVLRGDVEYLRALIDTDTYTGMYALLRSASFEQLPSTPADDAPFLPQTKKAREELKANIKNLISDFFGYTEQTWLEAYRGLYKMLMTLVRILEEFDRLFSLQKLRLGICEFSDVSRYTYECLWQNGERTDIAISEAEKYRAIYVDEYQDVNAIQHKIFEAISTPTDRFMVGDIKQSIYGFRGADSTIFAEMKSSFPQLCEEMDDAEASIFMSDNFRCDEGIIDFSNAIFDRLFGVLRESIGYVDDDRLRFAKRYDGIPTPPYRKPELCLLPKGAGTRSVSSDEGEELDLEPLVVAEKIRELLDGGRLNSGEPIKPGDIAIIIRANRGRDRKFAAALEALDIPCAVADTADFFLNPEILLLMSILNTIDNPNRDIYLASMLMSPIFRFTADDMALLTRERADTLYHTLVKYAEEHPDFEKLCGFLSWLERYRTYADGTAVDVLINDIYRDTGIMSFASPEGRECLNRFYEYARRFEASSFRGLYNFISYVNNIIDRKNPFDVREANLDPHAVKIITAHSSKGLEFPIVFFVGLSAPFKHGANDKMVYDNSFGVGINLRSEDGACLMTNPTRSIILDMKLRREIEEEARVLYVILTRARERLFVVGTAPKKLDNLVSDALLAAEEYDKYVVYSLKNFAEMIMFSSGIEPLSVEDFIEDISPELLTALYPPEESEESEGGEASGGGDEFDLLDSENPCEGLPVLSFDEDLPDDFGKTEDEIPASLYKGYERLSDILLRRFSFEYPGEYMTKMPRKLSVSRLYPEVLDESEDEVMTLEEAEGKLKLANMERLPVFATGTDLTESAKRGIATHLLFQFCDFERLLELGAKAELDRLAATRYISEADAKRVRIDEVEAFRRSPLLLEIIRAKRVYRELRFNTQLPMDMFTSNDALAESLGSRTILVQGVIDCLYEDMEGELHLVDYKTDRLTWEERKNPELAEQRLRASHSLQLSYYSEAVKMMFGKAPKTVEVYSLHLGRTVSVAKQ